MPPTPPAPVDTPAAWRGANLAAATHLWRVDLGPGDITELTAAAAHFRATGNDLGTITKADFPLAAVADRIARLADTLINGIGFQVLRGLPADTDPAVAATIFCGIGAHLGAARSQNAAGHILGHVRDTGADADDPNTRIYQTVARQTFHTDSADVVGLLCLREAKTGGDSLLVSAVTIYNRLRAAHPDLAELLFEPIATDRRGEVPEGAKPYTDIPVFSWHAGRLTVFYQRQYIDSAQRFPDAPRLTARHVAALDAFDALANDPDLHLTMRLRPGDIQFVYNHALLHDRTAFTDWPEQHRRRHLLRLWLAMPGDRPLPPCFAQRFGTTDVGNRGGIVTKHTRLHAPVEFA